MKIRTVSKYDLVEAFAKQAHESWAGWTRYLLSKCIMLPDGGAYIPKWAVDRWQRQAMTPYNSLSEAEKDGDRDEAEKYLEVLSERG